jgi:5-methyltetrahydrofolate--homocysteine methyltransferase
MQWFAGTLTKGPVIYIDAPLDKPRASLAPVEKPSSVEAQWTDLDYRITDLRNRINSLWFGGDAVPAWFPNTGPGSMAACLGPWPTFMPESVWFNEMPDHRLERILEQIRFDPENRYWKLIQELTRRALELAQGDFVVGLSDLGGDLDILASLRGEERLMVDLADSPELVAKCREAIGKLWFTYYDQQNELIRSLGQDGYTTWMPVWSDQPWSVYQCDASVMFSARMFEEFVLPELQEKSARMAHSIYHLDGPGEWQHLDLILSVPGIRAIQYVSRPGDPPNEDPYWAPQYRKIAEAGKGLFIIGDDPERFVALAKQMPAERLAFHIRAKSEAEGRRFVGQFDRKW